MFKSNCLTPDCKSKTNFLKYFCKECSKCTIDDCSKTRYIKSDFCSNHICKKCYTNKSINPLKYCVKCLCPEPGCRNLKINTNIKTSKCSEHSNKCDFIYKCTNFHSHNYIKNICNIPCEDSSKYYCINHLCEFKGCNKVKGLYYYSNHKCYSGCKIPDFCSKHKCSYYKCKRTTLENSRACNIHICKIKDCNLVIYRKNIMGSYSNRYCSNHLCHSSKCNNFNTNYLPEESKRRYYCPICECKSEGCIYDKMNGKYYCEYHNCACRGCFLKKEGSSNWCAKHLCKEHNKFVTGRDGLCETCIENLKKYNDKM